MLMLDIWKYRLDEVDKSVVAPRGAVALGVALQHGIPTLWMEVDPTQGIRDRFHFILVGAGSREVPAVAGRRHLGIVIAESGIVLHAYELPTYEATDRDVWYDPEHDPR